MTTLDRFNGLVRTATAESAIIANAIAAQAAKVTRLRAPAAKKLRMIDHEIKTQARFLRAMMRDLEVTR